MQPRQPRKIEACGPAARAGVGSSRRPRGRNSALRLRSLRNRSAQLRKAPPEVGGRSPVQIERGIKRVEHRPLDASKRIAIFQGDDSDAEVVCDPSRYPPVVRRHELAGFGQAQLQRLAKKGRDGMAKCGRRQIAADVVAADSALQGHGRLLARRPQGRPGLTGIEERPCRNPARRPEEQILSLGICPPGIEPRLAGGNGIGRKCARAFRPVWIGELRGDASNVVSAAHLSLVICISSPSLLVKAVVPTEHLRRFVQGARSLNPRPGRRFRPEMKDVGDSVGPSDAAAYTCVLGRTGEQPDDGYGAGRIRLSGEASRDHAVRPHRTAKLLIVPANHLVRADNLASPCRSTPL